MVLCISTYPVCGSSCAHLGASGGVKPAVSLLMLLDSEWVPACASGPGKQLDILKSL